MDELIRPNWHMAAIHFPIGLLVVGAMVEFFSFLGWRKSGFRIFGRWAFLLGAILSVPAAFGGLYALNDVVPQGLHALAETNPTAAETVRDHLWMSAFSTIGAMGIVVSWIALSDAWRDRLHLLYKLALAFVTSLLVLGAHHGGEIVYAHQIGPHAQGPVELPSTLPNQPISELADQALSLVQLHVYVAGLAGAMACVCLGWSIRNVSQPNDPGEYEQRISAQRIAAAFSPAVPPLTELALPIESTNSESPNHTPPVRTAGWWLFTAILFLAAAGSGLWYLAHSTDSWDLETLRQTIREPIQETDPDLTRRYAHTIVGLVLIGQTLLLALTGVVARRNGLLLILLAIPLVVALAAQVWLGVLLLFDGPSGTVTKFSIYPF